MRAFAQAGATRGARLIAVVVCVGVIFLSSSRSAGAFADYVYYEYLARLGPADRLQKIVHVVLFGTLGALFYRYLSHFATLHRLLLAASACLVIGAASEFVQLFTGRAASYADVGLNLASGVAGAAAALVASRRAEG